MNILLPSRYCDGREIVTVTIREVDFPLIAEIDFESQAFLIARDGVSIRTFEIKITEWLEANVDGGAWLGFECTEYSFRPPPIADYSNKRFCIHFRHEQDAVLFKMAFA
jgi:hypothetical protein